MTEKDLKKLNRKQLLELLLQQTERAELLEAELEETKQKLNNRLIKEKEAGSIAAAALQLSGIFEAAQTAADLYLESIKAATKSSKETEE